MCNGLGGQHFLHIFNLQTVYALDITCKTKNNEDSDVSPQDNEIRNVGYSITVLSEVQYSIVKFRGACDTAMT